MKKLLEEFSSTALLLIILVIAGTLVLGNQVVPDLGGGYGITSQDCDVNSSTVVTVGPASGGTHTILSAHSQRAWAKIQRLDNATTTVALSFDEGAAAVIGEGLHINTTTPESVDFGRNTDFPYVGEVTGVAAATTSVQVTECRY